MTKTIDVTRLSNGDVAITVNGVTRTLVNPTNITIKSLSDGTGLVIKKTDESFREVILLSDTFTIGGVTAPPTIAGQVTVLSDTIFGGSQAYTAPGKLAQVITFGALANRVHTAPAFLAGATSNSGLGVTYTSSSPSVATVNASTGLITPLTAGSTNITASQAGNSWYNAATPVVQPLTLS